MRDLLQKAVRLGMVAPKCAAPGCYRGRLTNCEECPACHGTGLDEDPAKVLMAAILWHSKRAYAVDMSPLRCAEGTLRQAIKSVQIMNGNAS